MEATIVLAEDDADLRVLCAQWLRRAGHRVWEAADGAEALSAVMAHRPDLLLLDIWMPILNGLEVLEHLSRAEHGVGPVSPHGREGLRAIGRLPDAVTGPAQPLGV